MAKKKRDEAVLEATKIFDAEMALVYRKHNIKTDETGVGPMANPVNTDELAMKNR